MIAIAQTPAQINRCSSVMRELRPHVDAADFTQRVQRQQAEGYQIAYLDSDGEVRVVAGFRIMEMLFSGRTLTSTTSSQDQPIDRAALVRSCSTGLSTMRSVNAANI